MLKIKKTEDKVKAALTAHPPSRDDDMLLIAYIWLHSKKHLIEYMSAREFLDLIAETKLPHATSIIRCRQKLQELNKNLRGVKYNIRHNKIEPAVKEEIINWSNDQEELFSIKEENNRGDM